MCLFTLNYRSKGNEIELFSVPLKWFRYNNVCNGCSVTVTSIWFSAGPSHFISRVSSPFFTRKDAEAILQISFACCIHLVSSA